MLDFLLLLAEVCFPSLFLILDLGPDNGEFKSTCLVGLGVNLGPERHGTPEQRPANTRVSVSVLRLFCNNVGKHGEVRDCPSTGRFCRHPRVNTEHMTLGLLMYGVHNLSLLKEAERPLSTWCDSLRS
jgi:hypothetical protein